MSKGVIRDLKGQIVCLGVFFNGKCGHLPMSVCLKDPRLSNAKTPVNNKGLPIEFAEPASLQESGCEHFD